MSRDLDFLTATEALSLFKSRELSPVELLDAVVARTSKVNALVNVFTEQLLEEAYAAARESEGRYVDGRGGGPRPLDGLPLALKEEQPIAGRTIEEGSLLEKGTIADVTHPVVQRVLDAGAVVHARTTTPEFSCAPFTHSTLWGVTRNPWNLEMSPGGSSGGSGAALAAGTTILATGSDIGGSIRLPASFNGVVGFKAPFGRIPGMAPFNYDTFCADGPMGRSVTDVALLQNILAGPHPHDAASLRPAYVLPTTFEDIEGVRIALCINLGDFPVDAAIEANTHAAADRLRAAGAIVDEVSLPWSRELITAAAWAHFGAIFGASISEMAGDQFELLQPYTRDFAARSVAGRSYVEGLMAEAEVYAPLGELLTSYDALIAPTCGAQGLVAGEDYVDGKLEVNGHVVDWMETLMTIPFNVIGRVPVLNVPSGIAPNGVPTGVQIVGRTYDDRTVFRIGAALEKVSDMWTRADWWPSL